MPVFKLSKNLLFPAPHLAREDGLLAVGGDLSPERLLLAYRAGIFPWYAEGEPILWWSPDPRMVLFPNEFHLSRRLRRILRGGTFRVTVDRAFDEVIGACASARGPKRDSTWITKDMIAAYCALHAMGYAHSFEVWYEDKLAGGLYGLSLGKCFFGESMFSAVSNASKIAAAQLVAYARTNGFTFIDCQIENDHLKTLGARNITRPDFFALLAEGLESPTRQGPWTLGEPR